MRSFTPLWIGASALALVACGDTQDSSEVTIDSAVVKSQSSALVTAVSSAGTNGGANIAAQLSEIGNTATSLIPRTKGAARGALEGETTCACPTAAQKTCTFSSCKIGTATASGTISWSSGKLVCTNLVFDVPAVGTTQVSGQSVTIGASHIAVTCSFTYGSSSLDGTLRTTGSTEVNDVAYTWDASLTANDLAWSTKAFTAGTVDVDATVDTSSAAEGDDSFHAAGSVSFP